MSDIEVGGGGGPVAFAERTKSVDALTKKEIISALTNGEITSEPSEDARFSNRELSLPNGESYDGTLLGNVPEGSGKYAWSDGSVYDGEWRRGMRHGNGKMRWASGACYEGEFSGGYMHGTGTYTDANSLTYKGRWRLNLKHGLGYQVYPNGDVLEGSWIQGWGEGPGKYTWGNGPLFSLSLRRKEEVESSPRIVSDSEIPFRVFSVATMSHLVDPTWRLLAASGGDTVKLFDVSADSGDPCVLSYTPTPGSAVNSVKWNHTNLVVASAGDDKKISLWRINGTSLGTVPVAGKDGGDSAEECLSAISFGRKGSKFIAAGGTGQIVKIWDLQKKLCVKKLRGHTSTITGVMYNCKDEHLASVSVGGDLIVHNLKTGARASELKDPHGQVLRVLDYSRFSRHLLLTAGDDGTVHLWDTTGRNPKMSWKQHSAPAAGVCFSPSDEKKIASVGMDKKLYTYDSGSKRSSSCISYEAPFSSLAFGDNGYILAAGTGNGRVVFYDVRKIPQPVTVLHAYSSSEAVTSLSWQTSKPVIVNEKNYDGEMALLGGTVDDSVIIPDPVPSTTPSDSQSTGSRGTATSTSNVPSAEQTPNRTLWSGAPPGRLHALRASDSFNDDMRVFSPIVEKWADSEVGFNNKDYLIDDKKPFASSSKGFPYGDGNKEHTKAAFSPFGTTTPTASTKSEDSSSSALTPPESWGGDRLSDKFNQLANEKISDKFPSRLGVSSTSGGSTSGSMFPLSSLGQTNIAANVSSEFPRIRDISSASETDKNLPSSPLFAKNMASPGNIDSLRLSPSLPRRTYAERISSSLSTGSPKIKKTGAETREETFSNLMPRPELVAASEALPIMNGGNMKQSQNDQQQVVGGSNFTLQLFQRTLEGTLDSFQNSVHDDMRNLHIEILRQFHMHEMEMSKVLSSVLENQAEIMKELQLLRKENQQLRQRL